MMDLKYHLPNPSINFIIRKKEKEKEKYCILFNLFKHKFKLKPFSLNTCIEMNHRLTN